jgi:4-hydroxy-tetrahydrodipicolinate synthase
MGPPRAPRLPLPEADKPALRKVLAGMGLLPTNAVAAE